MLISNFWAQIFHYQVSYIFWQFSDNGKVIFRNRWWSQYWSINKNLEGSKPKILELWCMDWPHRWSFKMERFTSIWSIQIDFRWSLGEITFGIKWSSPYPTDKEIQHDSQEKDKERINNLTSSENSLLHVHECIQQENVILFISPSCKHNFISASLAKRLHVPPKHILSTQVDGETVEFF